MYLEHFKNWYSVSVILKDLSLVHGDPSPRASVQDDISAKSSLKLL